MKSVIHRFRHALVVGAAAAACLAIAPAALAAPAAPSGKYCATLVDRAPSADADSPVLSRACSNVSQDDARRHLVRPGARTAAETGVAARTLLMIWYEHAGFQGAAEGVYGNYGTCDSSGYRLNPNNWWAHNMSSARGADRCNFATFYNLSQITWWSTWLDTDHLNAEQNDSVGRIQVRNY